jgi:ketosteroid isomerase-like protein
MSSPESDPRAVLRQQLETLAGGDVALHRTYFHDDCILRDMTHPANQYGGEAMHQRYTTYRTDFSEFHVEIDRLIGEGDTAMAEVRFSGTWADSGDPVSEHCCVSAVVADGKIIEEHYYYNPNELGKEY